MSMPSGSISTSRAWQRHHDKVTRRYVGFLKRARAVGELTGYSVTELAALTQLPVVARDYIYRTHFTAHARGKKVPAAVLKTYRKFIENGSGRATQTPRAG